MTAALDPGDRDAIRHLLIAGAGRLLLTGERDIRRLARQARYLVERASGSDGPLWARDGANAASWLQAYEAIGGDAIPEACADPACDVCQTPIRIRRAREWMTAPGPSPRMQAIQARRARAIGGGR